MQKVIDEKGIILGIALLIPIIAAQISAYYLDRESTNFQLIDAAFLFYSGFLFLGGYYFSHKTFLLRFLRWVCIHLSWPKSEKMAFLYFGLCIFLGLLVLSDAFVF